MTSSTWSPVLKQMIGLATIESASASPGTEVTVEHTVDAVRHKVRARVVQTPFYNPGRKTKTPA
jgi:glycine cleavage system aminomethyltransferase T